MATKGELTKIKLLEAAYTCIARDGLSNTTFQTIADEAQVSQPLVAKVFKKKSAVFPSAIAFKLKDAVRSTEEALNKARNKEPIDQLKAYFQVSFKNFLADPLLPRFYLSMYTASLVDPEVRAANIMIRKGAIDRISGILSQTKLSPAKQKETASTLHSFLVGALANKAFEGDQQYTKELRAITKMAERLLEENLN